MSAVEKESSPSTREMCTREAGWKISRVSERAGNQERTGDKERRWGKGQGMEKDRHQVDWGPGKCVLTKSFDLSTPPYHIRCLKPPLSSPPPTSPYSFISTCFSKKCP